VLEETVCPEPRLDKGFRQRWPGWWTADQDPDHRRWLHQWIGGSCGRPRHKRNSMPTEGKVNYRKSFDIDRQYMYPNLEGLDRCLSGTHRSRNGETVFPPCRMSWRFFCPRTAHVHLA